MKYSVTKGLSVGVSDTSISKEEIEAFLNLPNVASLLIKFSYLKIDNIVIPSVLLRIVKYGDQFDIDFSFDERDTGSISTMALMKKSTVMLLILGRSMK